jgi:hypothetical protein
MSIIYYMPVFLKEQAVRTNNRDLIDFCELFKVVSPNACLIDRTEGVLKTPFEFTSLYPIPGRDASDVSLNYNDVCIKRAENILKENESITIFYSGGIDSTVVLLSFYIAVRNGIGSFDQITVSTTPVAIVENPAMWEEIVIPHFRVTSANDGLRTMGDSNFFSERYVMGENADQLFGSDIILANMHLFNQDISTENILAFMATKNIAPGSTEYILNVFRNLKDKCPIELRNMADLIWWLNFSCKWQSVSLRTLCFSNFLDVSSEVSTLSRFETFFNTPDFQKLAIYDGMPRWGNTPSHYNYKMASRIFMNQFSFLDEYAATKIKVPSLYRVLATEQYKYNALSLSADGLITKVQTDINCINHT